MRRLRNILLMAVAGAGLAVGLGGCVVAPAPGYYGPRPYYRPYYRPYGYYYAPRPYYRYW
ncbi:hypothetical protein M0638_05460 [Roseomonas sp. NAR14]|uniref:Lipoprotein n=1 Tax=Roseomonas acroporae TaxID=2937791 RepID=A0A9X1Y5I4_9PROT|nr:hypothetical protein [Roseomonas acroporae]MCK8783828.1 hypothetical protein [Roseomonas acroporae]